MGQNDGTIQVDSSTLNSSLTGNFAALQSFFQSTTSGVGKALSSALTTLNDPTQGAVALDLQRISSEQNDLTSQNSEIQTNLNQEQPTLEDKFSLVNVILQALPILQQQISQQLAGA